VLPVRLMDTFSWFIGIYEGEGSISGFRVCDRVSSKRWELQIKMCDFDTVTRLAEYLNVKVRPVTHHLRKNPHWSKAWCVQLRDRERIWQIGKEIYPFLSSRRQEQWNLFFEDMKNMAKKYENTPHSWRYDFARLANVDATATLP